MLPRAKTVDFVLRWSCALSLVLAIIMCVIDDMTDCAKSEQIKDHEGSKFYLRMTVAWPLCLRHKYIIKKPARNIPQ